MIEKDFPLKMFRLEHLVKEQKSKVSKVVSDEDEDSAAKQMIL